ncbi:phage tail protein [Ferirhizobium litorale]|uniref:Phage tail protein n=1 Tax=Ferirhizobium litorale TaxID=2927786 RepID=A0AAE3U367_9HYPH|nr:phage tail protein [Fererhizobium litorale]MDI7923412.1 phage tail protein [Fererhizobium litorale]
MAIFTSIGTAFATALGLAGAASTFVAGATAFALQSIAGIGLNLLASAIAGQPEKPRFSVQGKLQTGGDVPRSVPIGWTATAGSLVYANTWGKAGKTPNAYFTQVIALSDVPVGGLAALWVNGEKVTIDYSDTSYGSWGFPVTQYKKGSDNALWVKFHDGKQTTADSFLVNTVSSSGRPYQSTRVGRGVAYVIITAQIKEDLFTGFPQFKFELNGMKMYDPSKDSTVGGSGSHRWADRSTWGGDGDHLPAVQLYNLLRGITYNGQWLYGLQNMPATRLPVADWIAEIAKCRTTIAGSGGSQPTYRCGGEIQVSAQIAEAVKAILTSCQGRLSESGGVYKMHLGASGAADYGITDADILSTEEQSFTPFFGLADTINGITAIYPSPAEGWNAKAAPPRYDAQFETEDGNRRLLADVPLDFVPYKDQVQRLMKSALAEARRARRHTFVLPPKYWPIEAGDFIDWTSERNGYEVKKFRVDGIVDRANLDIFVDMTEVDPSDYDWDQETDFRDEPDGRIDRTPPSPQPIVDWFAEAAAIEDNASNQRRPAIRLTWDNSADQIVDVDGVQFALRLAPEGTVIYQGRTDNVAEGAILISQGLLPLTNYEVRGKYIPHSDRETLWSGWLPVTTLNIKLTGDDIYLPGVIEGIQDFVDEATEWISNGVRETIDQAQQIALMALDQDLRNFDDKQVLRREITVKTDASRAEYTELIAVVTNEVESQAVAIETLTSQLAGKASAEAVSLLTTRVEDVEGEVSSFAEAITSLSAGTVGGDVATANFRMSVSAGPSGYASRIGMEARAGGTGDWRSASLFLDVPESAASPTRIVMQADQVVMTNGSTVKRPFVFQSGVLHLDEVKVGTLSALSATLGNVDISAANIGTLQVGTSNLDFNAITNRTNVSRSTGTVSVGSGWNNLGNSWTLDNPNPNYVLTNCDIALTLSRPSGSSTVSGAVRLYNVTDGVVVMSRGISMSGTSASVNLPDLTTIETTSSAGNKTYRWQYTTDIGGFTADVSCRQIVWKR